MSRLVVHVARLPWFEPLAVATGLNRREGALALLAGAGDPGAHGGRWSFVGCEPDQVFVGGVDDAAPFEALRRPDFASGGVVGVMSSGSPGCQSVTSKETIGSGANQFGPNRGSPSFRSVVKT